MSQIKPVLTGDVFVALQNIEVFDLFQKSPEKKSGILELGVKGNRIVTVNSSESCIFRFFQAVINFFKRVSTNQNNVNDLITKSIKVINDDSMITAYDRIKDIFQRNEKIRSYANRAKDMLNQVTAALYRDANEFVNKYPKFRKCKDSVSNYYDIVANKFLETKIYFFPAKASKI